MSSLNTPFSIMEVPVNVIRQERRKKLCSLERKKKIDFDYDCLCRLSERVCQNLLTESEISTRVPNMTLAWQENNITRSCSSTVNSSVTEFWLLAVFSLLCLTSLTFSSNFSIMKCTGGFSSGTEQVTFTTPPSITSFLSSVTLGLDTPLGKKQSISMFVLWAWASLGWVTAVAPNEGSFDLFLELRCYHRVIIEHVCASTEAGTLENIK